MRRSAWSVVILLGMAFAPNLSFPSERAEVKRRVSLDKAREQLKAIKGQQIPDGVLRVLEIAASVFNRDDASTSTLLCKGLIRNPKSRRGSVEYELAQTLEGKPVKVAETWGTGGRLQGRLQGVSLFLEREFMLSYLDGKLDGLIIFLPQGKAFRAIWDQDGKIRSQEVVRAWGEYTYEQIGGFTWRPLPEHLIPGEFDKGDNPKLFNDCLGKVKGFQRIVESSKAKIVYREFSGEYSATVNLDAGGEIVVHIGGSPKTVINMFAYEMDSENHPPEFKVSWATGEIVVQKFNDTGKRAFIIRCDYSGKVSVFVEDPTSQ